MKRKLNIQFVGNNLDLVRKMHEYLSENGLKMTHYNQDVHAECDYLIVIDPTEEAIKRLRLQEIWKDELREKHTQAQMIVLDWWTCECNGFVVPMGIPVQIDRFLALAQSINNVTYCPKCHAKTKTGIQHIFKPHGRQAPLFDIQNDVASLVNQLKIKGKFVEKFLEDLRNGVSVYQKELEERIGIIAIETPFKSDFDKIKDYLNRLSHQIKFHKTDLDLLELESLDKEASELLEYINSVGRNANIL
jgi:hypothetical protein